MANTKITSRVIADNSVGIDALNVTDGTNGQALVTDGSGGLSFSTISGYTDSDVETYLNTSEIYTDATNNRLGIGTNSPDVKLHLEDASRVDIKFEKTSSETHYIRKDGDFLRFRGHDDSTVLFELKNNTNGLNVCSFPAGDVGIGTTDPSAKLDIQVSNANGAYGASVVNLNVENTNTSVTEGGWLTVSGYMGNTANSGQYSMGGITGGKQTTAADGDYGGYLSLWTTSGGANGEANSGGYERMRIDSSGVVHAKAGFGTTPVTSCSGFSGTAGYKYLIQPVGAMEPFWAVYSGDNYKGRGKGYFRWWYGYGNNASGDNYRRCEVDLVNKNLEFYEVMVEDMAGTTYASSAPAYEWAYWSTRQTFNTQSSNTNYATSSSMTGSIEAMWGQAGGHGLYNSVIGNVCSWGALQPADAIGSGYTGNCGTYPSTTKGVPEPYYTDCSLRLGRPLVSSASFQQSTGAFSYWFNF